MNMKLTGVIILITVILSRSLNAQPGTIINKGKAKAGNIKSSSEREGIYNSNTGIAMKENEPGEKTGDTNKQGVKFELGDDNSGFYSGSYNSYTIQGLDREKPIAPYRHIRKVGEKGNFHFAKDYSELKGVAEPEVENISVSFSASPFRGGPGTPSVNFNSSSGNIYARLEAKGRSIKEALQLGDNNLKLSVIIFIYPAGADEISNYNGVFSRLYLTPAMAGGQTLDFDIKPSVNTVTPYYDPKDRYSYYLSSFPIIHTQQYFPRSGKYIIGIRVVSDVVDDWGNATNKKREVMGSFEYDFNIKDAAGIKKEGEEVMTMLQNGMRRLPKPLPPQWKLNSAASVVPGYTVAKYNQLYMDFYKDVKIIKTVLIPAPGASWKVVSNDNIIPAYKYCAQTVYFFVRDKEGNCYYHPCDLRQDYSGGGTYGPIHLAVFDEERVYVKCEELK